MLFSCLSTLCLSFVCAPQVPALDGGTPSPDPIPTEDSKGPLQLSFGLYQSDKATVMYRKFIPMLEAVQEDLGVRLEREVDVELRIFRSYEEGINALVNGQVDFVRFGPASYVLAKKRNAGLSLLAMEQKKGKTRFQGLIIARKDSGIQSLSDLHGKSFAFGDANSTIGRYLAQEQLVGANVFAEDLSRYEYLGRHDTVVRAVQLGDFVAGSVKESTFGKMNHDGQLVVVKSFQNVTKPWIARKGLSQDVRSALSDTLCELRNAEALSAFGVDRFVSSQDRDYDFVRKGMQVAEMFKPALPVSGASRASAPPQEVSSGK